MEHRVRGARGHRSPRRPGWAVLGVVLSGLGLVGEAPAAAQTPAAAVRGSGTAAHRHGAEVGRRLLGALVREANLPGLQVAVVRGDEVLWSDGFGLADLESRSPVTRLTRFRIGSLGKPLTAAAAVELAEEGRLDLDAPVRGYVPEFPDKGQPITSRQLLGHLSGIRHYGEEEPRVRYRTYADVVEALEIFADDPLVHPPGTGYEYSTYGYTLLSAVVQAAAGRDFLARMEEAVFRPMGMRYTVADHVDSIVPHRASFYRESEEDGRLLNAPFTDNSYKWAGGGLLSTAEDLARFGTGLAAGDLVPLSRVEEMFTSMVTAAGDTTGYGMGWRPRVDWKGRRVVRHGGSSVGGRAFLLVYPESRLAVAILVNASGAPVFHQEAQTLAHFFLDHADDGEPSEPAPAAPDATEPDAPAAEAVRIAGTYRFTAQRRDEEVAGVLRLTGSSRHPGWMEWAGGTAPVPLVVMDRHGDEIRVVGAGVHGVLNLWVRFDAEGFTGRWDWLGRTSEIRGRRTSGGPQGS